MTPETLTALLVAQGALFLLVFFRLKARGVPLPCERNCRELYCYEAEMRALLEAHFDEVYIRITPSFPDPDALKSILKRIEQFRKSVVNPRGPTQSHSTILAEFHLKERRAREIEERNRIEHLNLRITLVHRDVFLVPWWEQDSRQGLIKEEVNHFESIALAREGASGGRSILRLMRLVALCWRQWLTFTKSRPKFYVCWLHTQYVRHCA